jgi:oligopeptidase B
MEATEEVLLNRCHGRRRKSYFAVTGMEVSEDNNLLAYGVKSLRRQYTIHIKDLTTGKLLADEIINTEGLVCDDDKQNNFLHFQPITSHRKRYTGTHWGAAITQDRGSLSKEKIKQLYWVEPKNGQWIWIYSVASTFFRNRYRCTDESAYFQRIFQPRIRHYSMSSEPRRSLLIKHDDGWNFKIMSTKRHW